LAEDDAMLADCLAETLQDDGHVVCGIAATVAEAVALARLHRPDIAILDMQMRRGERGSDIADQLAASDDLGQMGILYVTGGAERVQREARVGHACLGKPYNQTDLIAALDIVRDIARDGGSTRPLPRRLHLLRPCSAARVG
jgi:CheY-like chemotaxis protein